MEDLEEDRFEITRLEDGQGRILSAIVHSRSLKRNVLLCIWESENKKVRKLYFSTDTEMETRDVLNYTGLAFKSNFAIGTVSNSLG